MAAIRLVEKFPASSEPVDVLVSSAIIEKHQPDLNTCELSNSQPQVLVSEKHCDITRAVKLLTDNHTNFLYKRHKIVLQNIKESNVYGFRLRDLVPIYQVLNTCAERVVRLPDIYKQGLLDLLEINQLPFLKEQSSDEITYFEVATNSISQLGYLLRTEDPDIRLAVCTTLEKFYTEYRLSVKCYDEPHLCSTSQGFCEQVMELSDITEILLKFYATLNDLDCLRLTILKLLQRLTEKSDLCCGKLIADGAAYVICSKMCDPQQANELVFRSCAIIWNLIENCDDLKLKLRWTQDLGHEQCLVNIQDILLDLLSQSHSKYCRSLRNDILTILALLIKQANMFDQLVHIPFVEIGLVKCLIHLITLDKIKSVNPLFRNLKLLPNEENFDLQKLVLSGLVEICHDPAALYIKWTFFDLTNALRFIFHAEQLMSDMRLLKALLDWVCPPTQIPNSCSTNPNQALDSENKSPTDASRPSPLLIPNPVTITLDPVGPNRTIQTRDNEDTLRSRCDSVGLADPMVCFPNQPYDSIQKWPQAYVEEIQLQILDVLTTLAPKLIDDCFLYDVPGRMVMLLKWCITPGPFVGQGNSFHGEGGRNNKRAQLRYCLRIIRNLLETDEDKIIDDFVCHDLIPILVNLIFTVSWHVKLNRHEVKEQSIRKPADQFKSSQRANPDQPIPQAEEDFVGLEMQSDVLLILAKLCGSDSNRRQLIGTEGIDCLIILLDQVAKRLAAIETGQRVSVDQCDSSGPEFHLLYHRGPLLNLAMATVDAVWSCVLGSTECEDYFLAQNGAVLLLNLLEWFPFSASGFLISCLVDLTENPKCLPYLVYWSGCRPLDQSDPITKMSSLEITAALLANTPDISSSTRISQILDRGDQTGSGDIGTDENQSASALNNRRLGLGMPMFAVPGPNLVQLLCHIWRSTEVEANFESTDLSHSSLHLTKSGHRKTYCSSARPIDHALIPSLWKMSRDQYDKLKLNIYALFLRLGFKSHENLSVSDQATLKRIEAYFDLKTSELWNQIKVEYEQQDFRPITPDQEMLAIIQDWGIKQRRQLESEQKDLFKTAEQAEKEEEQAYYSVIREIQREREKARSSFIDFLARTSNHDYLKQSRLDQLSAIDASRIRRPHLQPETVESTNGPKRPQTPTPTSNLIDLGGTRKPAISMPIIIMNSAIEKPNPLTHHATDVKGVNVTAFTAQKIMIESTPRKLFNKITPLEEEMLKVIP